jgi:hypothetical protein
LACSIDISGDEKVGDETIDAEVIEGDMESDPDDEYARSSITRVSSPKMYCERPVTESDKWSSTKDASFAWRLNSFCEVDGVMGDIGYMLDTFEMLLKLVAGN